MKCVLTKPTRFLVLLALCCAAIGLHVPAPAAAVPDKERLGGDALDEALRAFHEPDWRGTQRDASIEAHRLITFRFHGYPTSIRINVSRDGAAAATVRKLAFGRNLDLRLGFERAAQLKPDDVSALRETFSAAGFWKLHQEDGGYDESGRLVAVPVCADGTAWFIEALSGGRYNGIRRGCSEKGRREVSAIVGLFKRIARPLLPPDPNSGP
jgi:hypothetical protein